jgi:hypothetical protein
VRCLRAELRPHAHLGAPLLEDRQQPVPAHRGEAVPARGEHAAVVVHVDVVPAGELPLHLAEHLGVGVLDPAQRLVGEHDPEAERVAGRVALPEVHLMAGIELFGQRGEVEPARPPAEHGDPHSIAPSGCLRCQHMS